MSNENQRRSFDRPPSDRDEIYSERVPAGKRIYYFDVRSTKSGKDFFLTITEKKRVDEHRYEKHKLFLYKEDFAKFLRGLSGAIEHIRTECLPDYDFYNLPEFDFLDEEED